MSHYCLCNTNLKSPIFCAPIFSKCALVEVALSGYTAEGPLYLGTGRQLYIEDSQHLDRYCVEICEDIGHVYYFAQYIFKCSAVLIYVRAQFLYFVLCFLCIYLYMKLKLSSNGINHCSLFCNPEVILLISNFSCDN